MCTYNTIVIIVDIIDACVVVVDISGVIGSVVVIVSVDYY